MRFTSNGIIDSSFGENGITMTNGKVGWGIDGDYQYSFTVKPQTDNKILIGGTVYGETGNHSHFVIVRYTANGTVDSTFGINGKVISTFAQDTSNHSSISIIRKLDIQSNSRIVGGGIFHDSITNKDTFALARFYLNGRYDSSFGENGKSLINGTLGSSADLVSFSLQNDDKIIATGVSSNNKGIIVTRYLPDGSTDLSFGTNGYTITSFDTLYSEPNNVDFQNNKIIVAGTSSNNNRFYLTLVRYNNDVILATSLLNFRANKKQKSVVLSWQTNNEIDSNYFVLEKTNIERSLYWSILTTIEGKGNYAKTNAYTFEDLHPFEDENYYRLKQVDKDGKFTYSNVVPLRFDYGKIITMYPNPASAVININGLNPSSSSSLEIISNKGAILKKIIVTGINCSLNIENLLKGIYYLRIVQNSVETKIKFFKN